MQSKRTKIVATLGPASDNEEVLRGMIQAGLNVVRLNFSHSKPDYLDSILPLIRRLGEEEKKQVAILGDLRGPRIRVGEIEGGTITLETGKKIILTPEEVVGDTRRVSVSYSGMAQDVQEGNRILLDDGNLELIVDRITANNDIICSITQGGELSSNRGINLPGIRVGLPSLTKKDFEDIGYAIENDFDFLALSFAQSADDVRLLKAYLAAQGGDIPVIPKIERKNALDDIEKIVKESYGIMVARGDLALEMSIQDVPIAQKRIISVCRQNATPVITATQMLESMIHSHKPTRAEATDVANAVLDGTDALMLSGETAIGERPVEVVRTMAKIAASTERAWVAGQLPGPPALDPPQGIGATISFAGHVVSRSLEASAIVTYTNSGSTAVRVACHRPQIPILALSASEQTTRRLALVWGVESRVAERVHDSDNMAEVAIREARICEVAKPGDTIVLTAGTPTYGRSGRTNTLKVQRIPEEH